MGAPPADGTPGRRLAGTPGPRAGGALGPPSRMTGMKSPRARSVRSASSVSGSPLPVAAQAPFDVLGLAEGCFDPPAQLSEPHNLRVGQRRLLLPGWLDRQLPR